MKFIDTKTLSLSEKGSITIDDLISSQYSDLINVTFNGEHLFCLSAESHYAVNKSSFFENIETIYLGFHLGEPVNYCFAEKDDLVKIATIKILVRVESNIKSYLKTIQPFLTIKL